MLHAERGIALYDLRQHRALVYQYGLDAGVVCRFYAAITLWALGFPSQILAKSEGGLKLAQELGHPFSRAYVLAWTAFLHKLRREPRQG